MKRAKKSLPATIVVIALLIVFAVIASLYYTQYLEKEYDKEITNKLENFSKSGAEKTDRMMKQIYGNLTGFSKILINQENYDSQQQTNLLEELCEDNGYISIGIADVDGRLISTNGMTMNISSSENFQMSIKGESWITSTIVEGISNQVLVLSVPIEKEGSICGVICAVCEDSYFEQVLQVEEYKNDGITLLVNTDGTVACKTASKVEIQTGNNLFDLLSASGRNDDSDINELRRSMENAGEGRLNIWIGDSSYMYYCPLKNNDWYIVMIVPENVMVTGNDNVISSTYLIIAFFIILYLITFLIVRQMQRNNHKKIEQIAYVDELTGGISFEKFKKEAAEIIKDAAGRPYAMISIDIDKFKVINDIFGYEEGNKVIQYIWNVINDMIEQNETFAHRRADQFVILLNSEDEARMVERIEVLSEMVHQRETLNEKNYEIIISMGIYIINENTNDDFALDNAIDRAELAKQSVKGKHNQFYAVYDEKLRQKILRDQEIENRMERALERQEFKVYYQPKYDSRTCELNGAEALVRWYNDKTGMIFPNEFIPLFESNGFIVELDKYMFKQVCKDIRNWLDEGYKVVPVSVNLSQLQFYNLHFIEEYREILERYDVSPEYVQLELTETTLFSEESILNKIIDKLHDIGFKILMDDFGTGYSSLNMLKNVPIDILKLDKSFVDDIGDPKVDIVVSTIVSLGQSLDMKIVAEGVETKEQYEFLRDIFCDEIQGYYFSRPISEKEYRQKLIKEADIIGC